MLIKIIWKNLPQGKWIEQPTSFFEIWFFDHYFWFKLFPSDLLLFVFVKLSDKHIFIEFIKVELKIVLSRIYILLTPICIILVIHMYEKTFIFLDVCVVYLANIIFEFDLRFTLTFFKFPYLGIKMNRLAHFLFELLLILLREYFREK